MVAISLHKQYEYLENQINDWKNKHKEDFISENINYDLKEGDLISFYGGFNRDILFISKIFAIDKNQKYIYVYWDCFWFHLNLEDKDRKINKII